MISLPLRQFVALGVALFLGGMVVAYALVVGEGLRALGTMAFIAGIVWCAPYLRRILHGPPGAEDQHSWFRRVRRLQRWRKP